MAFGLILAVLGASGAMASDVHQFTYRVQVPVQSADCTQDASALATRFQTSSGLDSVQAECQGVSPLIDGTATYNVATVIVTYQAEYELTPTRAVFGGSEFLGQPDADWPLFDTYATCLDQLKRQQPKFETQTGALAVAAHCDAASNALETGYSLTIETFGKVTKQLYAFIPDFGPEGIRAGSKILTSAVQALSSSGATVAYADDQHVFFYASYDLPVLLSDLGSFDDPSECQDQISNADSIYLQSGIDSVVSFCEPEGQDSASLTTVGIGLDMSLETTTQDHYASYDECRADRERSVGNEISNGQNVVGAVCVPASPVGPGGYELHVYTYNR
jgi:hypothetical protein